MLPFYHQLAVPLVDTFYKVFPPLYLLVKSLTVLFESLITVALEVQISLKVMKVIA